jgi:serine/threonine-protein kinase 24/25/MST4
VSVLPICRERAKNLEEKGKESQGTAMDGPDFDPADLSSKREWVKIGSGSFGNVYKATLLGTTVAVKEIGKCVPPADARPFVILPPSIIPSSPSRLETRVGNLGCEKASPEKQTNATRRRTKRFPATIRFDRPYEPPLLTRSRVSHALKQKTSTRPERVAGLRRDMFYLRRFPHPNVVQVFGAFEEKGVLYMVMEYVAHSLRSKSVVRKVDLVRVLADVARALARLHAAGHVHRDVKARNVLVQRGPGYCAKLCDFGLARALPSAARPDVRGDLTPRIGPPKYRAPEVRDGETYDQSSDVYGFGVMCQQLVGQCREDAGKGAKDKEGKEREPSTDGAERGKDKKASKKDKESKESACSEEDLEFIQQLGMACAAENPSRRPTAAACLSRCLQRLGRRVSLCSAETARARVATWIDAPMDVGTGGKKTKEAREKSAASVSGEENNLGSRGGDEQIERDGDGGAGSVEARGGERWRRRRERDGGSGSDSDSDSVGAETPRRPRRPQEQATSRDTPRGSKRRKT